MKIIKIHILSLLMTLTTMLYGQTVSQSNAELAAQRFIMNSTNAAGAKFGLKSIIKTIKNFVNNNPVSYTVIFDGGGFATVAASLNSTPIIAYSPVGDYIEPNLSPEYTWWMDSYNKTIDYIISNSIIDLTAQAEWANLTNGLGGTGSTDHLMNSTWGQSACITSSTTGTDSFSYNKLINDGSSSSCNLCNGVGKCAAGCVAVAMAQIMRYWGYPLGAYDWCHMPDALLNGSTDTQIDAVARLIADIGDKVDMNYCQGGDCESEAWHDMVSTFKSYGYSNCTQIVLSPDFAGFDIWKTTIRNEIRAGRPVFYTGMNNDGGGHAFVIEGIDPSNDNMFYINWGWHGNQNTYYHLIDYTLTNFSPYNRFNTAIINISPDFLNCNSTKNIAANTQQSAQIFAGNITSSQKIEQGVTQSYAACNSIKLLPPFQALSGSIFSATVPLCSRVIPSNGARIATEEIIKDAVLEKDIAENKNITEEKEIHIAPISEITTESTGGIISFPNPFKDDLRIEVNVTSSEPFMISIYTPDGENVFNKRESLPVGKHALVYNLSFLRNGLYIFVFNNYKTKKEFKIMKE